MRMTLRSAGVSVRSGVSPIHAIMQHEGMTPWKLT
jgi:hypothetical protein